MSLKGIWIDPSDDNVVTLAGLGTVVTTIADKSDSGNDVDAKRPDLLLNFDGADAATSFTSQDLGARVITFAGTAQLDTAVKKFGSASLLLDGNSDYIDVPQTSPESLTLGTSNFTIEMWFNPSTVAAGDHQLYEQRTSGTEVRPLLYLDGDTPTLYVNGSVRITAGSAVVTSTWYHIALVRYSGTTRMYLDGVQTGADYVDANDYLAARVRIGANFAAGTFFGGSIDDVRVLVGTAAYTTDFTPPIRAHAMPPTFGYIGADRFLSFDDVSFMEAARIEPAFLANFEDSEAATSPPTATEESVNAATMSFENGANVDTAQFKFGVSSAEFPNATSVIRMPNIADYNFGTGDFTIEMWIRTTASQTAAQILYDNRVGSPVLSVPVIYINNSGTLHYFVDSNRIDSGAGAIAVNTWYHVAVARENAVTKMFLDGVQIGSSYADTNDYAPVGDLLLGNDTTLAGQLKGWMDSVRVVKGKAIYTDAFWPLPTAPHSRSLRDMGGPDFTVIAAIGDNSRSISEIVIDFDKEGLSASPQSPSTGSPLTSYISDDSVGRTITFNGTDKLDLTTFRHGNASLSTGSGTGNYVSIPNAADTALGSGDFTLEFWFNMTSSGGTPTILDQRLGGVCPLIYFSGAAPVYYVGGVRITGTAVSTATWYHFAAVRKDGVTRLYVDGVQSGPDWVDATVYPQGQINLGANTGGGNGFSGYIDSFRQITGLAIVPSVPVLSLSGDASPLDATGWRMKRTAMNIIAPSVGDEATNVAPVDGPAGGDYIAAMAYDSVGEYLVGHVFGVPGSAVAYAGPLGFEHDFRMGALPDDILEIVYSDQLLRTDERQRVEGYLAHKWGLEDSLPLAHPFALQAPDIVVEADLILTFDQNESPYVSEDASARVVTISGGAVEDSVVFKYGGTSMHFTGGSGPKVSVPDSADWVFGTNPFTVECWVYFDATPSAGSSHPLVTQSNVFVSPLEIAWSLVCNQQKLSWSYSTTGSDSIEIEPAWLPVLETWYHVAVSHDGHTLRHFVDGALLLETAHQNDYVDVAQPLTIGAYAGSGASSACRIDNVRVVNGEALYKYAFTPPHRGFRRPVAAALIANFNGPDALSSPPGYVSEDAGARVPVFTNDAQFDTAQKKFGVSSLLVDGTGDWIGFPDSEDWNFGAGDFTLEFWVRFNSTAGQQTFIAQWPGTTDRGFAFEMLSATNPRFVWSTTGLDVQIHSLSWSPTTAVWYHVAYVRFGDLTRFFVDGVQLGADGTGISGDTLFNSTDQLTIGARSDNTEPFDGWFDGVRIVKGTALYTTDFDVPIDAPGEPIV